MMKRTIFICNIVTLFLIIFSLILILTTNAIIFSYPKDWYVDSSINDNLKGCILIFGKNDVQHSIWPASLSFKFILLSVVVVFISFITIVIGNKTATRISAIINIFNAFLLILTFVFMLYIVIVYRDYGSTKYCHMSPTWILSLIFILCSSLALLVPSSIYLVIERNTFLN